MSALFKEVKKANTRQLVSRCTFYRTSLRITLGYLCQLSENWSAHAAICQVFTDTVHPQDVAIAVHTEKLLSSVAEEE